MENDDNFVKQEISLLKCGYISHFIVFILILLIHVIGILKLFWFSEPFYAIYGFLLIFIILILLFPSIPLIFVHLKKISLNLFKKMKTISLVIIFISLITGVLSCIFVWTTVINSKNFYENCPYHYTSKNIEKYLNQQKKLDCNKRMCIYDKKIDSNILPYNYICSFNSMKEYKNKNTMYIRTNDKNQKIYSDEYMTCDYLNNDKYKIENEIIKNYTETCGSNIVFYLCNLFEKPNDKSINSVNNKDTCPDSFYSVLMYLLGIFSILIDVLIAYVPLSIEYYIYRRLIDLLSLPRLGVINNEAVGINRTANSSENNNDNQNNGENNSQSNYVKQPTEIIIVEQDSLKDQNDDIIIASDIRKNSKDFKINSIYSNGNHLDKSNNKNDEEDEDVIFANKNNLVIGLKEKKNEKDNNSVVTNNDNNILPEKKLNENKSALLNVIPKKRQLRLVDFPDDINNENCENLENKEMSDGDNILKNNNNNIKNSVITINTINTKRIKNSNNIYNNIFNSNLNKNSVMNSQLITDDNINVSIAKSKLVLSKNPELKNSEFISIIKDKNKDKHITGTNTINSNDIKSENENIAQSMNVYNNRNKVNIENNVEKNQISKDNDLIVSSERGSLILKSKEDEEGKEDEKTDKIE